MTKNRFKNVWDALEDDPGMARNLTIRSDLMIRIERIIEKQGLTQADAARLMGVSQPRISDLKRGKIEKFTIDKLVNMLSRLGQQVDVTVKKTHKAA